MVGSSRWKRGEGEGEGGMELELEIGFFKGEEKEEKKGTRLCSSLFPLNSLPLSPPLCFPPRSPLSFYISFSPHIGPSFLLPFCILHPVF